MLELFRGSKASHGETIQDGTPKGSPSTVPGPLTPEILSAHLAGKIRMGAVPVDDSGVSWFGAIDIDAHADGKEVDILALEETIREWPAVVCRTRRGGAHVYVFFSEPVDSRLLIRMLNDWAKKLAKWGDPVEVFPKQGILTGTNKGNWIHLPYMGGDSTTTYAVVNGQPMDYEEFLAVARSRRMTAKDLEKRVGIEPSADLEKAPPCIRAMREIAEGECRSNAAVHFAVFLQKSNSPDIQGALNAWNVRTCQPPLTKSVIRDIAQRVSRNEYGYMCHHAPMCENCDKSECEQMEFGVKHKGVELNFSRIEKVNFEEPVYHLHLKGRVLVLTGEELIAWPKVRLKAMERLDELLPMLKPVQWEGMLRNLMTNIIVIDPPKNAGATTMAREMLDAFLAPIYERMHAGARNSYDDVQLRRPVILEDHFGLRIAFRGEDYITFAKRKRTQITPEQAWTVAMEQGFDHDTVPVAGKSVVIWWKSADQNPVPKYTEIKRKGEF